ncbi:MAG: FliM/FliN family flagellar motor switch protein [Candidatus Margulisiibacteriota bacterium]
MTERQTVKPEIAGQKRTIKLPPAIGDWTTYKPAQILVKKVKSGLYGFDRLSKEELDIVLQIHYRFVSRLLQQLKIDLKLAVELCSVQVEQTTYLNLLRGIASQGVQGKISIPGMHDPVFVFASLSLANTIINSALGSRDLEPQNRGLTEAESLVLSTTINEYLPHYSAVFENIFSDPSYAVINSPEINIDQSLNTSATFVCFNAEIILGENSIGKLYFGYHGSSLKSLIAKYKNEINQKPLDFSSLPTALLSKIIIPLRVYLGSTAITSNEIEQIEPGDVVTLDTPIDEALALDAGNILKLFCQAGIKNRKAAIRITSIGEPDVTKITPPSLIKEEPPTLAKVAQTSLLPTPHPLSPETTTPASIKETDRPTKKDEVLEDDLADEEFSEEEFSDEDFTDEDFADEELLDEDLGEDEKTGGG